MKTEMISGVLTKVAAGVLVAVTVGGGSAMVANAKTDAVQEQRITTLESNQQKMDALSDKLDETNKNVAVLNERLNQEVKRE